MKKYVQKRRLLWFGHHLKRMNNKREFQAQEMLKVGDWCSYYPMEWGNKNRPERVDNKQEAS